MATGTDYLLETVLRLAGIDVETGKAHILQLGRKFYEQDDLLHRLERNQKRIMQALNIPEEEHGKPGTGISPNAEHQPTIRIAGDGSR